jgi:two-component system OmpR family response regulator
MKTRILVVEDDGALARVLHDNLSFEGFHVQCAPDAHAALEASKTFSPDLVVLDVMLPDGNGFDLCRNLQRGGRTPVIILTARSMKVDKLRGLALGADDYVTKPFDLEELLARIKVVLRRARPSLKQLTLGGVTIDFEALRATHGDDDIHLSYREFDVLRYLAERRGRVVSRNELLSQIWSASALHPHRPWRRLLPDAGGGRRLCTRSSGTQRRLILRQLETPGGPSLPILALPAP